MKITLRNQPTPVAESVSLRLGSKEMAAVIAGAGSSPIRMGFELEFLMKGLTLEPDDILDDPQVALDRSPLSPTDLRAYLKGAVRQAMDVDGIESFEELFDFIRITELSDESALTELFTEYRDSVIQQSGDDEDDEDSFIDRLLDLDDLMRRPEWDVIAKVDLLNLIIPRLDVNEIGEGLGIETLDEGSLDPVAGMLERSGIRIPHRCVGYSCSEDKTYDDGYYLETDEDGFELISPILTLENGIDQLTSILGILHRNDKVITDATTGLHISMSVPDGMRDSFNALKLAVLSADDHVLGLFGRGSSTTATSFKSTVDALYNYAVRTLPTAITNPKSETEFRKLATSMEMIYHANHDKYRAINISGMLANDGRIEFRAMGGANYHRNTETVMNQIARFAYMLTIACTTHRDDVYYKKLYKIIREFMGDDSRGVQTDDDAAYATTVFTKLAKDPSFVVLLTDATFQQGSASNDLVRNTMMTMLTRDGGRKRYSLSEPVMHSSLPVEELLPIVHASPSEFQTGDDITRKQVQILVTAVLHAQLFGGHFDIHRVCASLGMGRVLDQIDMGAQSRVILAPNKHHVPLASLFALAADDHADWPIAFKNPFAYALMTDINHNGNAIDYHLKSVTVSGKPIESLLRPLESHVRKMARRAVIITNAAVIKAWEQHTGSK